MLMSYSSKVILSVARSRTPLQNNVTYFKFNSEYFLRRMITYISALKKRKQ